MRRANSFFIQKTIARPVAISGIGIHSGVEVDLKLLPAPANRGIVFRRVDCAGLEIPAHASEVCSLELATCLGRDDVMVSTVEHLLAAVRIRGIDNLIVELNGPEVPILDGSSLPYLRLLAAAGVHKQDALRRIVAVTAPLEVEQRHGKRIRVSPYPGLRITYSIDFGKCFIGRQGIDLEINRSSFVKELAGARTFSKLEDVQRMQSLGLGLGGNEDNCLVFDDNGPINAELRYPDEPVRHKALDAVGDLALLGAPIWAHLEVERGGHALHFAMIDALQKHPECWTWMAGETVPLDLPKTLVQRPALQLIADA